MTRQYRDWLARMEAHGVPLTYYDCPAEDCGGQIAAMKPPDPDHPFSTMVVCPHCEGPHFRLVHHDGEVELRTVHGETIEMGGTG